MNKMVNKKSVLKSITYECTEKRQKKKEKCVSSPITKKGKNLRKSTTKVKKMVRKANILNEWAENESSKVDSYEVPKILTNINTVRSEDSVIYIGNCSKNQLHNTTSIIDLTQSPVESYHENVDLLRSKTLKTIYFPSRNFDRKIKLRKSMATTSLITLPVLQKHKLPRKLSSTTVLSCDDKRKLGILDIPKQYLNSPDVSTDAKSFFEKSKLTITDYKMIDWILNIEKNIDVLSSPSTSGYNSSLDTDNSTEKIGSICDTNSKVKIKQNI